MLASPEERGAKYLLQVLKGASRLNALLVTEMLSLYGFPFGAVRKIVRADRKTVIVANNPVIMARVPFLSAITQLRRPMSQMGALKFAVANAYIFCWFTVYTLIYVGILFLGELLRGLEAAHLSAYFSSLCAFSTAGRSMLAGRRLAMSDAAIIMALNKFRTSSPTEFYKSAAFCAANREPTLDMQEAYVA
jgi:hypothetical protein